MRFRCFSQGCSYTGVLLAQVVIYAAVLPQFLIPNITTICPTTHDKAKPKDPLQIEDKTAIVTSRVSTLSIPLLPSELLLEIFLFHVQPEHSRFERGRFSDGHSWSSLYRFIFVSRRWYRLAIGYPRLWTFVDLSSPSGCIQSMLTRSQDMPLHVQPTCRAPHAYSYEQASIALIMRESHRIEFLKLYVTVQVAEALQPLSSSPIPLPIIRVLMVHNEIAEPSYPIPFPFETTLSTSFRTLHVSDINLGQVNRAFHRDLRELVLFLPDDDDMDSQAGSSEDENQVRTGGSGSNGGEFTLHHIMISMPHLEVLKVKTKLPSPPVHAGSALTLSHLRDLELSLESSDLNFLHHISCPPGPSLRLVIHHHSLNSDIFDSILHASTSFMVQGNSPLEVKTLTLYSHSSHHLFLAFWPRVIPPTEIAAAYSSGTRLELSFDIESDIDLATIWQSITRSKLIYKLDTLSLSFECARWTSVSLPSLSSAFSTLSYLRVFIAKNWPDARIREILSIKSSGQYLFPNLADVVTSDGVRDPEQWRVASMGATETSDDVDSPPSTVRCSGYTNSGIL